MTWGRGQGLGGETQGGVFGACGGRRVEIERNSTLKWVVHESQQCLKETV